MAGPYFEGQTKSLCGHYFPDVLLWGFERTEEHIARISICKYCGFYGRKDALSGTMTQLDNFIKYSEINHKELI